MRVSTVLTVVASVVVACGGHARMPEERGEPLPDDRDGFPPNADGHIASPEDSGPADRTEAVSPSDSPGRPDSSDLAPADALDGLDRPGRPDELEPLDSLATNDPDDQFQPPDDLDAQVGPTDASEPGDRSDVADQPDVPADSDRLGAPDRPDTSTDPGPPPAPVTCWSDSFEWDADPGWEATGLWHRIHAGQDLVDVWAAPPYDYVTLAGPATLTKPKDGTHAFWYGRDEDGSYLGTPNESQVAGGGTSSEPHEGALVSPWLDLTGAASATLYFWSWWEIESQHPAGYDLSTVEVTADGETWTEVARLNPPVVPPGANPVLPYTVNGVGMPPSWHRTVVPLDAVAGGPARVRFRFRTGDVFFNAFRGWVVDEVSIECVDQRGSIPASPRFSR